MHGLPCAVVAPSLSSMENNWPARLQQLQALLQDDLSERIASDFHAPFTEDFCKRVDLALLQHWIRPTIRSSRIFSLALQPTDFPSIGHIGQGQFGVVKAARCRVDNRIYAIKSITKLAAVRAHANHMVERHIHLLANYHAPYLFAAFQTPNTLHLVMEYAPCSSLWDRIANGSNSNQTKVLGADETLWWASQMAASIRWLHQTGFAHRDIKPENFLLYPENNLKVTDFGSAASLLRDGTVTPASCYSLTGTPDYIAPEVLRHAELLATHGTGSVYTKAIDWWSLGATIFELAAGAPPFFSPSIPATYSKILRADYDLSCVSDMVKPVVEALLTSPESRSSAPEIPMVRRPRSPLPNVMPIQTNLAESEWSAATLMSFEEFSSDDAMYGMGSRQERWIGWTWLPVHTRPDSPPRTPDRTATCSAPKSTLRRRPRGAYQEMLACVSLSAEDVSAEKVTMRVSNLERKHRVLDLRLRALSAALAGISSRMA